MSRQKKHQGNPRRKKKIRNKEPLFIPVTKSREPTKPESTESTEFGVMLKDILIEAGQQDLIEERHIPIEQTK